jgi:signal transduction histidine kinase
MREGARLLAMNLSRAGDLVHSFKQVAADQVSGERRRIALGDWLQELVTSLGPMLRKKNLAVHVECPQGLEAETYPGALGQVITNLVVNAATHGFDEGQQGDLRIVVQRADPGRIRIAVSDNGRGIPPQNLPRIFDPFFTTARQRGSTGLGLHIVYNLVVQTLRGRIEVSSRPGAGTAYLIDLPKTSPGESSKTIPGEPCKPLDGEKPQSSPQAAARSRDEANLAATAAIPATETGEIA